MLKTAWGIAVDLTADASLAAVPPAHAERVGAHVWLDVSPVLTHPPADRTGRRLAPEEAVWLRHGVALAAPAVAARHAPLHTTVTVHHVWFPETDYQPEGLAAAVIQWLEEEFTLPPHGVTATFDHPANRYVYTW
ncbi:hypothetical protein ACH4D5_10470 [Streptomyces sp. NPDC018029]|uniref:hypothetical protein n=1 Tax=Streptomyces sp. NPDC018029 TaxID=3365032 RepID=UPI00379D0E3E